MELGDPGIYIMGSIFKRFFERFTPLAQIQVIKYGVSFKLCLPKQLLEITQNYFQKLISFKSLLVRSDASPI